METQFRQEPFKLIQNKSDEKKKKCNPPTSTNILTNTNITTTRNIKATCEKICHFGHTATTAKWYTNTITHWTNIPYGANLCKRCYLRGRRGRSSPPTIGKPSNKKNGRNKTYLVVVLTGVSISFNRVPSYKNKKRERHIKCRASSKLSTCFSIEGLVLKALYQTFVNRNCMETDLFTVDSHTAFHKKLRDGRPLRISCHS